MPTDFNIIDDEPDAPEPTNDIDHLNLTRIHLIAQERRAAFRRLFWARAVVFAFACLSLMTAVDAFRVKSSARFWFALGSLAFAFLAVRAAFRLRRFAVTRSNDEAERPDGNVYASLSDGTHFAKQLDELNGRGN